MQLTKLLHLKPRRRRVALRHFDIGGAEPEGLTPMCTRPGNMVNHRQHAVTLLYAVRAPVCALAAHYNDTRACGGQRLSMPIAVLPYDAEAIVVQQRRKLLREGIAQRGARDLGVFFLARVPAFVTCQMHDLRDMVIYPRCRHAHLVSIRVDKGRPVLFLVVRFKGDKEARSSLGVGEQGVACLEGKQPLVMEVCAHAL